MGVGAGVAGVLRALSALSLDNWLASWSGLGPLCCPAPGVPTLPTLLVWVLRVGVGAGVPGTMGDLTELVLLVRLRIDLSIDNNPLGPHHSLQS